MGKVQHVHFQVLPDGRVFKGDYAFNGCHGCEARAAGIEPCRTLRCGYLSNPLKSRLIFKDTGKRVRKV